MNLLLLALMAFSLEAANAPAPWLEEKENYLAESSSYEETLYQEASLSPEEQQAERDIIARGTSITLEPTIDGLRFIIYVVYSDGSRKTIWEHLASEFNKKITLEKMEEIFLKETGD